MKKFIKTLISQSFWVIDQRITPEVVLDESASADSRTGSRKDVPLSSKAGT